MYNCKLPQLVYDLCKSWYAFHLMQIISTVSEQIDNDSQPGNAALSPHPERRAVARTFMGGGGGVHIHVFMFCPTSFFSNQIQIHQFEKEICRAKHEYMNRHPPPQLTF